MSGIEIQILATFLLSVATAIIGIGNTWPSYALQTLESDDSPIGYKITKTDASLIGSVVMLGSITSILVVGYLSDKIGRKRTEIVSGLSYLLGWSIISTAKSVTQILIGRYMLGFGTGLHVVTGCIYIGEISQTSIKGTLICILPLMYNIVTLISYTEGWLCSYDVITYLNLITAVSFVVILLFIKETPIYLLRQGMEKEALKSLKFYRGTSTITQEILDEIVSMRSQLMKYEIIDKTVSTTPELDYENEKLNPVNENESANQSITKTNPSVWSTLRTSKSTQRALVILVVQIILAVFMGMIGIEAYAGQFFMQAAPSLSPHVCSVILAIVQTVLCVLTVCITDLIPRRVLMITSCLLSAGCMACLATMLRWAWVPEWGIPLVMTLYCITYHLGVLNIPTVQIVECLPPHMNSFGTTVVMCSMFFANFAILFAFKPAVDILGLDGLFFLFSIIGLITAAVAFLVMRETRGQSFEIIQTMFENGYVYQRKKYLYHNSEN